MSPELFALAHLAIIAALLLALGIFERRGRTRYLSRDGVRYRRLNTASMLKQINKRNG